MITVWSSYEPVFDSICPTLCSNDDVVECIFVILISLEAVYAFKDNIESEDDINPKEVICDEPLTVPAGTPTPLAIVVTPSVKCAEPVSIESTTLPTLPKWPLPSVVPSPVCARPVEADEYKFEVFTDVISPAPASISASFTAFVVGTELGSSAIEAETLRNADVPKVLFFNSPLTSNNTSKSLPPPDATLESVNVLNVGESFVFSPKSIFVAVPLILAVIEPWWFDEKDEPLITPSVSNLFFTSESV